MGEELPKGWVCIFLGEVIERAAKTDPKVNPSKRFQYIDIGSIDNATFKIVSAKQYLGVDAPSRARQVIKAGDTLFSTVRTYLKNIACVDMKYDAQIASTGFTVLRPSTAIIEKYIFYFVQWDSFIEKLSKLQRGSSYPAVRDEDVFAQEIPVPPFNEQKRIVAKIEELFSNLDAGVKALEKAKELLKQYRQSVLKAAVTGELTKKWREKTRASWSQPPNSSNAS